MELDQIKTARARRSSWRTVLWYGNEGGGERAPGTTFVGLAREMANSMIGWTMAEARCWAGPQPSSWRWRW